MDAQKFNKLITRIKYDGEAFDEIYYFYYSRAKHYVARHFLDYDLARDAVQEFFGMEIFKANIPNYIESPIEWICTSCKNVALRLIKEKHSEQIKLQVDNFDDDILAIEFEKISVTGEQNSVNEEVLATRNVVDDYFSILSKAGVSDRMIKKFKKMDRTTVEICIMHYWEGFSLKEIAEKLNANYDTIKSKFRRGKNFLKTFSKLHLFAYFFHSNV